jgi:hypothetical protein
MRRWLETKQNGTVAASRPVLMQKSRLLHKGHTPALPRAYDMQKILA